MARCRTILEQEEVKPGTGNLPKFMVSLLKAWYGDAATKENEWGFSWLPRIDANYSHLPAIHPDGRRKSEGLVSLRAESGGGAPNASCTARP